MKEEFKLTIDDSREERYRLLFSPFQEYLPDIRPSNSDNYILMLADAMHKQGLDEQTACRLILKDHPLVLDEQQVKALTGLHHPQADDEQRAAHFLHTNERPAYPHEAFQWRYEVPRQADWQDRNRVAPCSSV